MVKHRSTKTVGHLHPFVGESVLTDFSALLDSLSSKENTFKLQYLKDEWLSKFVGPNTDPADQRRDRAIDKWLGMERRNAATNLRLFYGLEAEFGFASSERVIEVAARVIRALIGDKPDEERLRGCFSNGASVTIRREPGALARKFTDQASVTSEAMEWAQSFVLNSELWTFLSFPYGFKPEIVQGNVLFTVPKTAEIDRCACKEPDLNMYIQRGLGLYLRRCLRKVGIDLRDQTKNQDLAYKGSLPKGHPDARNLATLDLSSASDTLSESLVQRLLPLEWFWALDSVRSKRTYVRDEWIPLNMFSSMGNGFTFELETLIFYALTKAVCYLTGTKGTISVYGDDIIAPTKVAPLLARVFHYFGFLINTKKSHWKGTFRESCGKHYDCGKDVSPFYVREPIDNQERLIHFLNQLRKWSLIGNRIGCDPNYFDIWKKYSKFVDKRFHGGWDVDSVGVLVCSGVARARLVRKDQKRLNKCAHGAYLQWHHERERSEEVVQTSRTSKPMEKTFVTRPYRYYGEDLVHYFWGLE
jgi:hypothetical protein